MRKHSGVTNNLLIEDNTYFTLVFSLSINSQ
jgi:hypothetical protein